MQNERHGPSDQQAIFGSDRQVLREHLGRRSYRRMTDDSAFRRSGRAGRVVN